MDGKDGDMTPVRTTARALAVAMLRFRTGEADESRLTELRDALPPERRRLLRGVAAGETPSTVALQVLARRAEAWLSAAPHVDEMCRLWRVARAETPEGVTTPDEALAKALAEQSPDRATTLWQAAREPLMRLAREEVGHACERMGALADDGKTADARAFLAATKDAWIDALAYARRRRGQSGRLPRMLLDAMALSAGPADEMVPVAASRQVARRAVERLASERALRRLAVRPLAYVDGFIALTDERAPRVGWRERKGVAGLLELVSLSTEACVAALLDTDGDAAPAEWLSRLASVAVLGEPVLRLALALSRTDADAVRRHGATLLLRRARIDAAFAVAKPRLPDEALDVLADATQSDPDLLEAAATLAPWPQPSPWLGPVGAESLARWRAWPAAGSLCRALREQWDEDFLMRPVFQDALRAALDETGRPQTAMAPHLSCQLGAAEHDAGDLAGLLEEAIG